MTDAERLLREYIERFESGDSSGASEVVAKAEGKEHAKLLALIEGYLEHGAPAQAWDADAFEGSVSEQAVARVAELWSTAAGELPHQLVELRNTRQIKRRDLVAGLAEKLGAKDNEEKVGRYYHELERGLLPASGVSKKVFGALAGILGTTAEALRTAGEAVAPSAGGEPGQLFARMASPPQTAGMTTEDRMAATSSGRPAEADWDEVDRLFRGGD